MGQPIGQVADRAWRVQTTLLAAVPYATWRFSNPALPGLFGITPVAISLMIVAAVQVLTPGLSGWGWWDARASRLRAMLVRAGMLATGLLLLVELRTVVCWETRYLTEWGVTVNEVLSFIEFVCAVLSLVGWCLARPVAVRGEAMRPDFYSYAAAALWPLAVHAVAYVLGAAELPWSLAVCTVSGVAVWVASSVWFRRRQPGRLDCLLALMGHLTFSVIRAFALGEDVGIDFWTNAPHVGWYAALVGFVLVVMLPDNRTRRSAESDTASVMSDIPAPVEPLPDLQGVGLLSPKESEVTRRTISGETDATIAQELSISKSTVATLRRRSYAKLGVSGKRELLAKVREVEKTALLSEEAASSVALGATETGKDKSDFYGPLKRALVLSILGMLAVFDPPCRPEVNGVIVESFDNCCEWLIAAVVLAASARVIARGNNTGSDERRGRDGLARTALVLLGAITIPWTLCDAWSFADAGPILLYPMLYILLARFVGSALLLLCVIGIGRSEGGRSQRWISTAFREGLDAILTEGALVWVVVAAALVLPTAAYISPELVWMMDALSWALPVLCIAYLAWRGALASQATPRSPRQEKRAALYLQGRGLGELQAEVMIRLCMGYSPKEVCASCHVSPNSVHAYRARAYEALGVHSLNDLRLLLIEDANFTDLARLYPKK